MNPRRTFFSALMAALPIAATGGGRDEASTKHHAVFDLSGDTPEKWDSALRNVENFRLALGADRVEAHLIVHGKAHPLLQRTQTDMEARLRALHAGGVRLSLCRNTMKRFQIAPESLFDFADTVDAAVAELVRKQEAGWAYLKVGG